MEFLGIGITELIAILLIAFLVLGPRDLVKVSRSLGRTLHNLRESETVRAALDLGRRLRQLPETLAEQAGVEEMKSELHQQGKAIKDLEGQFSAWTRAPEPLSQKSRPPEEPPAEGGDPEEG